jgi:hypothetical protein
MSSRSEVLNSDIVRAKVLLCSGPLNVAFEKLWTHPQRKEIVISFLILLHQIMRASVPLMQCALRRCDELESTDRLAKEVAAYYRRHIDEERDHDLWTLEDLAAAGLDPNEVLSITPPPEVAQLAGAQYYWIHHHHPIMLLGYITVLEAFPPTNEQIDSMRDASGVPEAAFRTFRMHGELDPTHSIEIDETFNALPLSSNHIEMIGLSIFQTCESLAASVQSLRPYRFAK